MTEHITTGWRRNYIIPDLHLTQPRSSQHLEWRKSYGVDSLLDWKPPEVLLKYWPGGIYGVDKDGHPILYQLSKGFDAQGKQRHKDIWK